MENTQYHGFTLIEMIGVMAIIAILASTLAPSIIKDIDRAVGEGEQENLQTLSHDLEIYIRENKAIPSASDWVNAVSSVSTHPVNKISQNKRFFNRGYYVDPRFFTNSDSNFSTYTQTSGLTSVPNSPRIMIVSNLNSNAPAAPTTSTAFNAIWDQTSGVSLLEGENIKIERVNLKGLFHRVLLTNDHTSSQPGYMLESGSTNSIALATTAPADTTIYLLSDTKVSLVDAPFTSGVLTKKFITDQAKNFAYQNDGSNWLWINP
ncbi:MAG: type II secretion system protein [Gammaproteobacteria bacterium]